VTERPKARKRFGQHFLVDGRTADRIVEYAGIGAGDTVLEIGPGRGILTGRLMEKAGSVTAVEIDRDLVAELYNRFSGDSRLRLVEANILDTDLNTLFGDTPGKVKVVSNIPYYISAPIIDLLIRSRTLISAAVLMVQKEVADRLTSAPGSKEYGLTTLNLALYASCRKVMTVMPGSFRPPPEVTSSVIVITFDECPRYRLSDERVFRDLTGAAFRKRRKMVRNSVVPYLLSLGIGEVDAMAVLAGAGVDQTARPETIDVSAFVAMSNGVSALVSGVRRREDTP